MKNTFPLSAWQSFVAIILIILGGWWNLFGGSSCAFIYFFDLDPNLEENLNKFKLFNGYAAILYLIAIYLFLFWARFFRFAALIVALAITIFSWWAGLGELVFNSVINGANYSDKGIFVRFLTFTSAGIIAFYGLIFAAFRANQTDKQIEQTQKQLEIAEDNRLDTRFKDAIILLSDNKSTSRLGALNTLFEISKSESKRMINNSKYVSSYPNIIVETLCDFICEQSKYEAKKADENNRMIKPKVEIQKALDILFLPPKSVISDSKNYEKRASRYFKETFYKVDDDYFYLNNAILTAYNLNSLYLCSTNLNDVTIKTQDLINEINYKTLDSAKNKEDCPTTCAQKTFFKGNSLKYKSFNMVDLSGSNFQKTDLEEASFENADILDADFRGADNLVASQIIEAKNWRDAILDDDLRQATEELAKKRAEENSKQDTNFE